MFGIRVSKKLDVKGSLRVLLGPSSFLEEFGNGLHFRLDGLVHMPVL